MHQTYLHTAMAATAPFQVSSANGGVRAMFLNRYPWYEEYPSSPPSFVLNGFMFSLVGLHDVAHTATQVFGAAQGKKASRLFSEGLASLKALIGLFDTGSGSNYDLRHFTAGFGAPVVARAEYHVTHINLLGTLATIAPKEHFLKATRQRWLSYHNGKRVRGN